MPKNDWETPRTLIVALQRKYTMLRDVCASDKNFVVPQYWTKEQNCLTKDWDSCFVNDVNNSHWETPGKIYTCCWWMNPPYSRGYINTFMTKAANSGVPLLALVNVSTSTSWFHDNIANKVDWIFLFKRRLHFESNGVPSKNPEYDNMLVGYNLPNYMKELVDEGLVSGVVLKKI